MATLEAPLDDDTVQPLGQSSEALDELAKVFGMMCDASKSVDAAEISLQMPKGTEPAALTALGLFKVLAVYAKLATVDDTRDYFAAFVAQLMTIAPSDEDRCKYLAKMEGYWRAWLGSMAQLYAKQSQNQPEDVHVPVV